MRNIAVQQHQMWLSHRQLPIRFHQFTLQVGEHSTLPPRLGVHIILKLVDCQHKTHICVYIQQAQAELFLLLEMIIVVHNLQLLGLVSQVALIQFY
jgi:hypothetical protein